MHLIQSDLFSMMVLALERMVIISILASTNYEPDHRQGRNSSWKDYDF
jgi:hypothetical protein